jgi:hypothetical protein
MELPTKKLGTGGTEESPAADALVSLSLRERSWTSIRAQYIAIIKIEPVD